MSPAVKQGWKSAGLHLAKHGTWGLIAAALLQFFGPPIAEAVAGRIAGVPAQPSAPVDIAEITTNAVAIADQHARDLITKEIATVRVELRELTRQVEDLAPVPVELRELTRQVDRMAGALEESNRRRNP